MSAITEIIRLEADGTVSFGNYNTSEKKKVADFDAFGDAYTVKTHDELTRVEKNGKLLLEAVPGAAFHNFSLTERLVSFGAEGAGDTQVTLGLEPTTEYRAVVNGVNIGNVESNLSGKVNFSVELNGSPQDVRIEKY
ncbi:MAG: endosialidase [Defluviitaleaceae bacterium]|nr:endosialidase [Defluviitaleaceae bacterium]